MSTDTIADMLIRIKNALAAKHQAVVVPHSNIKEAIAKLLTDGKYLQSYEVVEQKPQKQLNLQLRYVGDLPAISGVLRISKPGRRLYSTVNKIPSTLGGYGLTIISTSKGLMSDKNARKNNLGGEVVCKVW
jgi:small subunit ribosomal protein S8